MVPKLRVTGAAKPKLKQVVSKGNIIDKGVKYMIQHRKVENTKTKDRRGLYHFVDCNVIPNSLPLPTKYIFIFNSCMFGMRMLI